MAAEAPKVERTEGDQVKGMLKVWNLEKGFGFMTCDDGGSDLFIHQSAINVAGDRYRAVAPGTTLLCTYYVRGGKDTAKDVTKGDGTPLPGFETRLEAATKINAAAAISATLPVPAGMIGGKVKFMNKDKGFGFITPDDGSEDMFVHVGDVQGQRILDADEPVSYTTAIKKGDRPQAVQVVPLRPQAPAPAGYPQQPQGYPGAYGGYGAPAPGAYGGYPAPGGYGAPPQQAGFAPAPQSGSAAQGKVKWFNELKGFGFLIPAQGGTEVYFKGTDVTGGGAVLQAEEAVTYENQSNQSGKVWAINISRARGGSKRKAEGGYDDGAYKRPQYAPPSPYGAPGGPYAQPQPGYGAPPAQQPQYGGQYAQPQQPGYAAPPAQEAYGQQPGYGAPAPPQHYQQAPPQQQQYY